MSLFRKMLLILLFMGMMLPAYSAPEQEKKEKIFLGGFALAVLIFLGIVAFDPLLGLIISAVGFCGAVIAVKK